MTRPAADRASGALPGPGQPVERVAVVGCGLVGASFALACGAHGLRVAAWDVRPDVRTEALRRGVAGRVPETLPEAVAGADLVLVAVPVAAVAESVAAVDAALAAPAVVTDAGSVKASVVRAVERLDLGPARFVGGHPMAGSERSGVAAADATLFQGATWVLTPTARTDARAFDRAGTLLRRLDTRVLAMEPFVHDRLVAVASHLPQALATTLMSSAADVADAAGEGVLALAGGGFRDATRVARSDPDLWTAILLDNRDAVLAALEGFDARLRDLAAAVRAGDAAAVRGALEAGRSASERLPRKDRVGDLVDLVVPVEDRPGALVAVTTALGEAGVNIEDLNMRHASDAASGALVVGVDGHAVAQHAQRLLAARGFTSHLEPRAGA